MATKTFGNTTFGVLPEFGFETIVIAGFFKMGPVGGLGVSITANLRCTTVAKRAVCGLYDAAKNLVANSQTETRLIPVSGYTAQTFESQGTKPILVGNTWYWIAIKGESLAGDFKISYTAAGGNGVNGEFSAWGNLPAADVANVIDADALLDIYCTYITDEPRMGFVHKIGLPTPVSVGIGF